MPTVSITVPRSIAAAERKLNELGEIATASEWSRAAIVATYVEIQPEGRPRRNTPDSGSMESAAAFARRGIVGLKSDTTVAIYARAWLDRFPRPKPGSKVTLPTEDWPPTALEDPRYGRVEDREAIIAAAEAAGTGASKAVDIAKNKAAMAAAIKGSPAVAVAAAEALANNQPDIVAKAVVSSPKADDAVTDARLDRRVPPEERRKMVEHNREMSEQGEAAAAAMHTRMEHSGMVDHAATLDVRTARMWMRKAVAHYERNPLMTDEQRADTDQALDEIEYVMSLLRGQTAEWTDADREFLAAFGIEDEGVSR